MHCHGSQAKGSGMKKIRGAPIEARVGRGLGQMISRGTFIGRRLGDSRNEAEHFLRCPACSGWIDCRDLGQVFQHEGPLPHPAQDQPQ